jgi:hypothetical protein
MGKRATESGKFAHTVSSLFSYRYRSTPPTQPESLKMRTNGYGEDDRDLVRRFAIREDGTARYPAAVTADRAASNVISLAEYRRQIGAGSVVREIRG